MNKTFVSASNPMLAQLVERKQAGNPVRVGVIGAGDYGESLVCQLGQIPGMQASVVCDLNIEKAFEVYQMVGYDRADVASSDDRGAIADRVIARKPVVTTDLEQAVCAPVDVIVDCTGEPEVGCRVAAGAIAQGKHVVMVNVEADITAGVPLAQRAKNAGVVYTLADGDQPSLITELADWARCLGFDIVSAGKGTKLYPLEKALRMLADREHPTKSDVTYLDGSKTQIEMASTANACGLMVDVVGMHGPSLRTQEIPEQLRPQFAGGILNQSGVIDFVNQVLPDGKMIQQDAMTGVFVVGTCNALKGMETMARKGVVMSADRRHALLYRPFHLVGVETPWSILKAVLDGVPTACPGETQRVDVVAVAKKNLKEGMVLGGLGMDDVRGVAMTMAQASGLLPVGLAAGATLMTSVSAGEYLTVDQVKQPAGSLAWQLRMGP